MTFSSSPVTRTSWRSLILAPALVGLAFFTLAWAVGAGCADDGHDHDPVREATEGLTTVERGLTETEQGAQRYAQGDHAEAVAAMEAGVAEQHQGASGLHHGLSLMGSMMESCGGDHMRAMATMDNTLEAMGRAVDDMGEPGSAAADAAVETMNGLLPTMRAEVDKIRGDMECMGHDAMREDPMDGGMAGEGTGR